MTIPWIETERLVLRLARPEDTAAFLDFHVRNREHLRPWSPTFPEGFFGEEYWRLRIALDRQEFLDDRSCRFVMIPKEEPERIIGTANFSQFVRGVFHACYLGYTLDGERQGKGVMSEALRGGIDYVFGELNLHRIMANYMPHNVRSGRVLRGLGFSVEGYARDYLRIDGRWEDHVLTSLTNRAWKG